MVDGGPQEVHVQAETGSVGKVNVAVQKELDYRKNIVPIEQAANPNRKLVPLGEVAINVTDIAKNNPALALKIMANQAGARMETFGQVGTLMAIESNEFYGDGPTKAPTTDSDERKIAEAQVEAVLAEQPLEPEIIKGKLIQLADTLNTTAYNLIREHGLSVVDKASQAVGGREILQQQVKAQLEGDEPPAVVQIKAAAEAAKKEVQQAHDKALEQVGEVLESNKTQTELPEINARVDRNSKQEDPYQGGADDSSLGPSETGDSPKNPLKEIGVELRQQLDAREMEAKQQLVKSRNIEWNSLSPEEQALSSDELLRLLFNKTREQKVPEIEELNKKLEKELAEIDAEADRVEAEHREKWEEEQRQHDKEAARKAEDYALREKAIKQTMSDAMESWRVEMADQGVEVIPGNGGIGDRVNVVSTTTPQSVPTAPPNTQARQIPLDSEALTDKVEETAFVEPEAPPEQGSEKSESAPPQAEPEVKTTNDQSESQSPVQNLQEDRPANFESIEKDGPGNLKRYEVTVADPIIRQSTNESRDQHESPSVDRLRFYFEEQLEEVWANYESGRYEGMLDQKIMQEVKESLKMIKHLFGLEGKEAFRLLAAKKIAQNYLETYPELFPNLEKIIKEFVIPTHAVRESLDHVPLQNYDNQKYNSPIVNRLDEMFIFILDREVALEYWQNLHSKPKAS
jgi:hypothetical protein